MRNIFFWKNAQFLRYTDIKKLAFNINLQIKLEFQKDENVILHRQITLALQANEIVFTYILALKLLF